MSQDELDLLSKEDLIHLILDQAKQLGQLKAVYEALKLKLDQIQKKPPTSSKNLSQPPSKD
jgi:hypothetical protein